MITVFDIETSYQIIGKKKDPSFNDPNNFIVSIGLNDEYFFSIIMRLLTIKN